jgi:hypothetical protein
MGIGTTQKDQDKAASPVARATLEYLTGPARGTATWLGGDE